MVRVVFVCLGNICRSPMAEGVFVHLSGLRGWEDRFQVDSAGTSGYHIGELPDPRTTQTLAKHKVSLNHRARQFTSKDFGDYDYILVMDKSNYQNVVALRGAQREKVWMMRVFEEANPAEYATKLEVPDPYYGGESGFEDVYQMLVRTQENLLEFIASREGWIA